MDLSRMGAVLTPHWGAASDIGPVRSHNEDRWLAAPPLYAVADGMGGHADGELAARTALDVLCARLAAGPQEGQGQGFLDLDAAIAAAALAVSDLAGRDPAGASSPWDAPTPGAPGTTLTGALTTSLDGTPHWLVFNIGDSRTYLCAGGALRRLTRDHSAREEARHHPLAGDLAADAPAPNIVTRALGAGTAGLPEPDYFTCLVARGDRLLICSDGVHGAVADSDLAVVLTTREDPQQAANAVVDLALAGGTRDNATAVVVDVAELSPAWPEGTPIGADVREVRRVRPAPTVTARRAPARGED